jgi:hypothetical protein
MELLFMMTTVMMIMMVVCPAHMDIGSPYCHYCSVFHALIVGIIMSSCTKLDPFMVEVWSKLHPSVVVDPL